MAVNRRLFRTATLLILVMWTGCGGDSDSAARKTVDERLRHQAHIARQIESTSALVVRVVGQVGDERFTILRLNGVQQSADKFLDRAEFVRALRGIEKDNDLAIVVMPAGGFSGHPDTNVVRLLTTNGFSTVRAFTERWGMRFPVRKAVDP